MSESDTMFNEQDPEMCRCTTMLSTDPSYDNRIIVSTLKYKSGLPRITGTCPGWWKQSFRQRLWSLVWFQVRATSCHLTSLKSAWKTAPKFTWIWRVRWSHVKSGGRCGSRTQHRPTSPKRPRLGFRRSATTLYPSLTGPPPPRPKSAGLLRLVIRREHHQHDPHNTKASLITAIHRVFADACGKGMLPVPDAYRGGDWGLRRLQWIDVSSTT